MIHIRQTVLDGETYVSLDDIKAAFNDADLIQGALALLKVGHDMQRPPEEIIQRAAASFIAHGIGALEPPTPKNQQN